MPRIAYQSENEEEFFTRLDKLMDLSARSLHIKRTVISKLMDEGLDVYKRQLIHVVRRRGRTTKDCFRM